MKKVDLLGAAHDDIADARQDEGVDAAGDAVFHDDISLMVVDAAVVRESAPANDEGKLDEEGETKRNGINEVTIDKDSDDVHHRIGKEDCQGLAVNKV